MLSSDKIKVLVVDDLHPVFMEQMNPSIFEILYQPQIEASKISNSLEGVHVLVVRSKVRVDQFLCRKASQLKMVVRAGSGMDNIDMDWAQSTGIECINAAGSNRQAVGEQTLAMLLSLLTNLSKADKEVRQYIWDREGNRGEELNGKTVGIIGYGNTGSAFAKVLRGFDLKILAYDKYKTGFGTEFVKEAAMDEIFEESDVLSLHIPLTNETRQMLGREYISKFRKPIWFLNLSRGEIVNTEAILEMMDENKIKGFAADVLENEKLDTFNQKEKDIFEKLIAYKRVILSPHVGGWSDNSYRNISVKLADALNLKFENIGVLAKGFKEAEKFP